MGHQLRGRRRIGWAVLLGLCVAACGGSGSQYVARQERYYGDQPVVARGAVADEEIYASAQAESYSPSPSYDEPEDDAWYGESEGGELEGLAANIAGLGTVSPEVRGEFQPSGSELAQAPAEREPVEETSEPILIYTATLYMGVYQVELSQQQAIAVATDMGGFLFSQDDITVVVRIPAERFEEAIERLEALGDVLHRNIQVQDISEEFHDLNIRRDTLDAMRVRLQELLARATTVAETLQIERELQRITLEIETLEGRLRFLRDRVAFSTITVTFQPNVPEVQAQAPVQLPFPWISQLGLNSLLYLW